MPITISADGTDIAYSTLGKGPALLLVDGALCSRAFGPMPGYAKLLAEHFTVYWYDRRGRGESGDNKPHAVQREIEDLAAMVKVTGEAPFVVGTSSGAALALHGAAVGIPMTKLLMYEAPYVPVPPGGKSAAQHTDALWELVRNDRRGAAVHYFMCDVVGMPGVIGYLFRLFPMWSKLKKVAHTLPYDLSILADVGFLESGAKKVTVPTMVAGGAKSPEPLKEAVRRVHTAVPGSTLHWVEGATHNLQPAPAVAMMREWFR